MPLEASHIRFSLDIKERLGVKDIKKYVSGVIYPDSRYVTRLNRQLTHPENFRENDFFTKDDFRKGWYSHLLYDKIKHEYTKKHLPEIFSDNSTNHKQMSNDLWVKLTALKILQDVDDVKAYDIKTYLPYLDYIENPNGEDTTTLKGYNNFFQKMYAVPDQVSFDSCYQMWKFLGIADEVIKKLKFQTEEYHDNPKIREFIGRVYLQTLNCVKVLEKS